MAKVTTVYMNICGTQKELTMDEFLKLREGNPDIRSLRFIPIDNRMYEATPEQYRKWKSEMNRAYYLRRIAKNTEIVSFTRYKDGELLVDQMTSDRSIDVEEVALESCMAAALHIALDKLSAADRDLIGAIYFHNMSDQEYGKKLGISRQAVRKRRMKALARIKKLMRV